MTVKPRLRDRNSKRRARRLEVRMMVEATYALGGADAARKLVDTLGVATRCPACYQAERHFKRRGGCTVCQFGVLHPRKTCQQPDRHEARIVCGYPLPCPHHSIFVMLEMSAPLAKVGAAAIEKLGTSLVAAGAVVGTALENAIAKYGLAHTGRTCSRLPNPHSACCPECPNP